MSTAPVAPRQISRRTLWLLAGGIVAALVAGAVGGAVAARWLVPSTGTSCDTVQVAQNVLPAVVTVFATGADGQGGTGSGAITTADGVIVTNDHVIHDAVNQGVIEVLLNTGEKLPATLVGTDPITDLAVLRIAKTRLPTLPLDANNTVVVGQPVVALGAPLGLSGSVTSGIVSALDRNVPVPTGAGGTTILTGAIQTDASINPGNSGGPLVTCDGRLIGVNTAGATVPNAAGDAGGGSVGINFAVSAQTATRITSEILTNGRATHPWIGAQTAEITPAMANRFGTPSGLFVQQVAANGPAAKAGLRAGDVIIAIAGRPASSLSLAWLLVSAKVGDQVELEFLREGASQRATLTLVEQP
ncbi:MAG: trypsin-like peptidase domain-containing protein [Micropruina sp.]|nr:trypsin-like peptidase domain-containing protein [Micropruina sp.]